MAMIAQAFVGPLPSSSLSVARFNASRCLSSSFKLGSCHFSWNASKKWKVESKKTSLSIKCEQGAKGGGIDVWLGRLAMVGFTIAITIEISTGKGFLENFGVKTPIPLLALVLTGLVGLLTAFFVLQSAPQDQ